MTPVILDCDTGTDDAVAIMLAALHSDLDLLGVTTVWGNHDVAHTTDNSLRVLDLLDPGVVEVREATVTVERADPTTYGATRFSFSGGAAGAPVRVALRADHDRFLDLLFAGLGAGSGPDPGIG